MMDKMGLFSHYCFLLDTSIGWIIVESEYQSLLHNLSWLGPQCVDLDTWDMDEDDEVTVMANTEK